MQLSQIFEGPSGSFAGLDVESVWIAQDLRRARPAKGRIVFCHPRAGFDGRDYVPYAREKGAVAAVVECRIDDPILQIIVPSARNALQMTITSLYGSTQDGHPTMGAVERMRDVLDVRFPDGTDFGDGSPASRVSRVHALTAYQRGAPAEIVELLALGYPGFARRHGGLAGFPELAVFEYYLAGSQRSSFGELAIVQRSLVHEVAKSPQVLNTLHWRQLEELVAELFAKEGFEVQLTRSSSDSEVDLFATRHDFFGPQLFVVECKRWSRDRRIGPNLVRQLYGVVEREGATQGVLVATSGFTRGAAKEQNRCAYRHRILLRDSDDILDWVRRLQDHSL